MPIRIACHPDPFQRLAQSLAPLLGRAILASITTPSSYPIATLAGTFACAFDWDEDERSVILLIATGEELTDLRLARLATVNATVTTLDGAPVTRVTTHLECGTTVRIDEDTVTPSTDPTW